MATTSVGPDRTPYQALEKYPDAAFITDDLALYFGNDGDVKIEYDEDGNNVLNISGADWRFSDTVQLQFGNDGDAYISWDGSELDISGAKLSYISGDIQLSDTAELQFGNASDMRLVWSGTNFNITGTGTGKTVVSGTDIELSDTVQLQFGDQSDYSLMYDGTGLKLTTLPTSNPGAGYLFTSDAGGNQIRQGT